MYQNRKSRYKSKHIQEQSEFVVHVCPHICTKGHSERCSLGRREKKNQIKITELCRFSRWGVRHLSSSSVFGFFKAQQKLLADCWKFSLMPAHLNMLFSGSKCLFPPPHLPNSYLIFKKVQESFCAIFFLWEEMEYAQCLLSVDFSPVLASPFCPPSVLCSLQHCQRNVAKIQIWSCLSPS